LYFVLFVGHILHSSTPHSIYRCCLCGATCRPTLATCFCRQ